MTPDAPTPDPDRPPGPDEPTREAPAAPPGPAAAPPEPGLYRSASDRVLFGVCGGIAERYGFEPLLVRLAFAATLLLGGAGVLFYLATAILIPRAPRPDGPAGATGPGRALGPTDGLLRLLLGLAAAIGIVVGLGFVAALSFGATVVLGAWPASIALVVVGVLLALNARSRRTTGSLLVLALAVALPATTAVLADVSVDRSAGERTVRPASVAQARQGYRLGLGQLTVDLRALRPGRGTVATIPARVDVGQLRVLFPPQPCVAWRIVTRTRFGAQRGVVGADGASVDWGAGDRRRTVVVNPGRADRRPQITLDLRVGVGEIVVADRWPDLRGSARHRDVSRAVDDGAALRTRACPAARSSSAKAPRP